MPNLQHAVHLALDAAQSLSASQAVAAKAAGLTTIIRYLWSGSKGLTQSEARIISDAGLQIVVIWEGRGDQYEMYNTDQALSDAKHALSLAAALGIPKGACLYFCGCDFDASDEQIRGGITDYFSTLSPLIRAAGYRIGVYGNGACCQHLLDGELVDCTWLWGVRMSNGSPEFLASNRWSIRQYATLTEFGLSADPDDVQGDIGSWSLAPPPAQSAATAQSPSSGGVITTDLQIPAALSLQHALQVQGYYRGQLDGLWGPQSQKALADYYDSVARDTPTAPATPSP